MSNDTLLRAVTAVRTAQDYVTLPGYRALPTQAPSPTVREYRDEKDFWADVLRGNEPGEKLRSGDQVVLKGFRLAAWVPRVPGLYWKDESRRLRAAAESERLPPGSALGVYTPVGQTRRILGGVGNVRLLPSGTGRLIGASSSGMYWQGIPMLVQDEAWRAHGDIPAGIEADVQGVWTPMPREYAQMLGGDAGIPRYCLVVDRREQVVPQKTGWGGWSSAWTIFEYRGTDDRLTYDFAYCTFEVRPDTALLRPEDYIAPRIRPTIELATDFLADYIEHYHGQVLTDFDEEVPRFDALLPVNELMSREIDPGRLRAFVERVKKQALSPETVRYERLPGILMQHFGAIELRTLALDYLGLELEHLVGLDAGLTDQVDALMDYCERQDRLEELVTGVVQERPQLRDELAIST